MKTLLATLLLIAGCLSVAGAASLAEVQVIDRTTGQTLETWRHRGRLYVAGTPGNRYAVSLRNRSDGRVLTVISVDGVNAISGETANASQSGYVLAPGQAAEIAGWRKSMDEVAAFYFTRIGDSYAARTERPQNVGVIGVAVFNEYVPPPPPPAQIGAQEKAEASADNATGAPPVPPPRPHRHPPPKRSWAPAMANASRPVSATPSSAARARSRTKSSPFTTTAAPT